MPDKPKTVEEALEFAQRQLAVETAQRRLDYIDVSRNSTYISFEEEVRPNSLYWVIEENCH